jgi:hypothetical protein
LANSIYSGEQEGGLVNLDTVSVLEQRLEFLKGITETALMCNWSPGRVAELHHHLLDEVIRIDNLMFDVYEETRSPELAYLVWEGHMEDLRHWLGLILGIKIRFV